ncbi:hypothetical protein KKH23_00910 [Patescibacteria group bacterium]|nr:hypothetical protein [Patescibacteria group bacterium]MBU0777052.1 hypothetical protein [Patescibacteria group bacterium]MBU0845746.1 hypothetical protein [Patescibacteria group bacterium]MBU0923204.1 hypothetical protein [Patescibacteria group bacterium]MBU1066494.1 hypothetical protein [Patescibacteria group bacterium]
MGNIELNPVKLGDLEVGWWKAHNDKDKPRMAQLLIEHNVALYGFAPEEAQEALKSLVQGVNYHDTREWDKAVEVTTSYYQKIKDKTGLGFDPKEVAKLEVGWWKLHDELEENPDKTRLAETFAKLYATQFGIGVEKMTKAGKLKAEATREHDLAEKSGTPEDEVENHWDKANQLLIEFYSELKTAIGG